MNAIGTACTKNFYCGQLTETCRPDKVKIKYIVVFD